MSLKDDHGLCDEYLPEPEHGPMPAALKAAWIIGLAFFLASIIYAFLIY